MAPGHEKLERALELSTRMLEAGMAGQWEQVNTLRPECDALVRASHPQDETTRTALRRLQQQYAALAALATQARSEAMSGMARQRQNHRAVSAYLAPMGNR